MNFSSTGTIERSPLPLFPCVMCDTPMEWGPATQATNGRLVRLKDKSGRPMEQWNCPKCHFFYRTLIPRTVPRKYQPGQTEIKRMCLACRRREVTGRAQYCGNATCNRVRRQKLGDLGHTASST